MLPLLNINVGIKDNGIFFKAHALRAIEAYSIAGGRKVNIILQKKICFPIFTI